MYSQVRDLIWGVVQSLWIRAALRPPYPFAVVTEEGSVDMGFSPIWRHEVSI